MGPYSNLQRSLPLQLLLFLFLPTVVQAQFEYTTQNGAITITRYTDPFRPGAAVIIPDRIDGLPVTIIGKEAFAQAFGLRDVTIPESVTTIGERAFWRTALDSVTIPRNVATIGDRAFDECKSLAEIIVDPLNPFYRSVEGVLFDHDQTRILQFPIGKFELPPFIPVSSYTIPDSVTAIGNGAFAFSLLAEVTMGSRVTIIGDGAFGASGRLRSVSIPHGVTRIGNGAFANCSSLTQTTIPESVTTLGDGAFANTGLTNVTIPASVKTIGDRAFARCHNLTEITVDELNPFYRSAEGVLFDYGQTQLLQYPRGKAGTAYTVPDSVMAIANSAFFFSRLTRVTMGGSVATIGDEAFSLCVDLTTLTFSSGLNSIGNDAFSSCVALTNVTIPDGVLTIGNNAFKGTALTQVTIPDSVTGIGRQAFDSCKDLTQVKIGNGVIDIGERAFADCLGLASLTLGTNVATIGDWAFLSCFGISQVTIPDSVTTIGNHAFRASGLVQLEIGRGVKSIGFRAFDGGLLQAITVNAQNPFYRSVDGILFDRGQTRLVRYPSAKSGVAYTIPDGVTIIEGAAFYGSRLTRVTIPEGVATIGDLAFESSQLLDDVTIPDGVTAIGNEAFLDCTSLVNVVIPDSVVALGSGAFAGCTGLVRATIGNRVTSIGDFAFRGCYRLVGVTIGHSVTVIGVEAFNNCSGLTSVTIPDGVTTVAKSAFSACRGLTSITLGNGITQIGETVFVDCSSLTSVTIPAGVVSIGYWAFGSCSRLTTVTIPGSVTAIDESAFSRCSSLARAYFGGDAPRTGPLLFADANQATVYYLPGTVGWSATFADRPTAIWSLPYPVILSSGPGFGVGANGFGFLISWATDAPVVVEASPDLATPVWTPVSTNALAGGSSQYTDAQWTDHPNRFYRLVAP